MNGYNDNRLNLNCNNLGYYRDGCGVGIALAPKTHIHMAKTYNNIYSKIISVENLTLAEKRARKGKTKKLYVIEFEANLQENLLKLHEELKSQTYKPEPLVNFIVKDPKTRKISKSAFRDRVVHHAICNIIEPIFDKGFIYDSCANRKGKGNLFALKRLEFFKRKVTNNLKLESFCLKADIKHYFEEVNHYILISIIRRKIIDEKVIGLIERILVNLPQTCQLQASCSNLGQIWEGGEKRHETKIYSN